MDIGNDDYTACSAEKMGLTAKLMQAGARKRKILLFGKGSRLGTAIFRV